MKGSGLTEEEERDLAEVVQMLTVVKFLALPAIIVIGSLVYLGMRLV